MKDRQKMAAVRIGTVGTSVIAVIMSTLLAGPAMAETLVERGKDLSNAHCSRCHVVDPDRPFMGISSTPSFSLMVNYLEDWEDRFRSFHVRLPHQSIVRFRSEPVDPEYVELHPPVEIDHEDIDALVEFARTLWDENSRLSR